MSDLSIRGFGGPEGIGGFRETMLVHFPDAAVRQQLRAFADLLLHLALGSESLRDFAKETFLEAALIAAAADLRQLERFLSLVGRAYADDFTLSETDQKLSRLAGKQVARVTGVAIALEEAVAKARADCGARNG